MTPDMTPERWTEVKAVLARAMETPAGAARDAWLERACAGDPELRAEVASLLDADAAAGGDVSSSGAGLGGAAHALLGAPDDRALHALLETALGQQYEIVRPLGRGGMGAVYLARERALERFVAIKVLRPDLALAPESRERFRREARVAAQLSHPGILPLHTFGEVRGIWYFVMGYVRGVSLAERLRVEGRLASGEAHRILAELADALECAHRHGVVHRDIKPANVLLDDETGRAVLADFGISKVQGAGDSLTATGAVVGTPHFMSPEQALGASTVDERSDLYSLGAVGYTMLAGRAPFADSAAHEDSGGGLRYRRLVSEPPPLAVVAPWVPAELARVVMRCLERDPDARWPSARSLEDALARAGGDPAAALLPEALRDLPTFGPYALLWAASWTALAARALHGAVDRALLLLVAVIVPLGFALHVWNSGRSGLRAADLARIAFWPPEWWGMWWPRALRRPTDLWPRLPWPARLVRAVLSAFLVAMPTLVLARDAIERALGTAASAAAAGGRFTAVEAALVLGAAAVVSGALWWARRRGLSAGEIVRVLFGATSPSPGWGAPRVARLLAADGSGGDGGVRAPDRDSAADHRRAIGDLAVALPEPAAATGALAVRSAQRLLAAIEACDAEVAALSRDASAAELDRLTAQLAALDDGDGGGGAAAERRELRELVRGQLDVVRRMRVRCEVVSQRRARLFSLMRGLWTQLRLLRGDGALRETATESSASAADRVRALCDEVARELDAGAGGGSVRAPDDALAARPPASTPTR